MGLELVRAQAVCTPPAQLIKVELVVVAVALVVMVVAVAATAAGAALEAAAIVWPA